MSVVDLDDDHDEELVDVKLPSGATFAVYKRETGELKSRVKKYMQDNKFTNVSDLATVDQILMLELLSWRYSNWASQQKDYWGEPVDEAAMVKLVKENSTELRQMKNSLGIDKKSRDSERGENSVYDYLEKLRTRAKEFGVMREEQVAKAIELFKELQAVIVLHDNCTPDERDELKVRESDVINWIRTEAIPEFEKVDEHFRHNKARLWVREM